MFLGPAEIVVIVAFIAIFFFGKNKVMDWARSLKEVKDEFKAERIIDVESKKV